MPCNLALSITKAAVTDAQLLALLTEQAIRTVVEAYLLEKYAEHQPAFLSAGNGAVVFMVGGISVTVYQGRVNVNAGSYPSAQARKLARALSDELTQLLAQAADMLFAQQVQNALAQLGPVQAQSVTVDDQGTARQAVVLTLKF